LRKEKMALDEETRQAISVGVNGFFLLLAVWLVSPFFKLEASDFENAGRNALRLFFGLTILIIFLGKWAFDLFAPQGLAKKVANSKAIALFVLNIAVLGFIVYIVAQAAALFLSSSWTQDASQF
jgi:uncharacterized PurR-regulated membrane protein YhhQ (DUF165 family)